MRDEAVDLPLVFAVYLVKQVEPKNMLADHYLVAVLERFARYHSTVQKRSVSRGQIGQDVFGFFCYGIDKRVDPGMKPGNLCVVYTYICLKSAAQNYLLAFKRYRHGNKITGQKYDGGAQVSRLGFGFLHKE